MESERGPSFFPIRRQPRSGEFGVRLVDAPLLQQGRNEDREQDRLAARVIVLTSNPERSVGVRLGVVQAAQLQPDQRTNSPRVLHAPRRTATLRIVEGPRDPLVDLAMLPRRPQRE